MKGSITTISAGTGSIRGKGSVVGTAAGLTTGSGWFAQKGTLAGTTAGTSTVAQVTRIEVEIPSTITLIAEYASVIH